MFTFGLLKIKTMAKEQWYVKTKGYKETFDSLKLANTSFNRIKKIIQDEEEGKVQMYHRPDGGQWEIVKELDYEDED